MALRRALLADRTRRYRSCAALVEALAGAEKNLRETMDLSDTLFPEEFSSEDSSLLLAMQTKAPDGGCGSSSQLHGVSSPHLPYESQTAGEEWDHNRISMKFVWCPPGEITMLFPNKGEKQESAYRAAVTLSKGFWLGIGSLPKPNGNLRVYAVGRTFLARIQRTTFLRMRGIIPTHTVSASLSHMKWDANRLTAGVCTTCKGMSTNGVSTGIKTGLPAA